MDRQPSQLCLSSALCMRRKKRRPEREQHVFMVLLVSSLEDDEVRLLAELLRCIAHALLHTPSRSANQARTFTINTLLREATSLLLPRLRAPFFARCGAVIWKPLRLEVDLRQRVRSMRWRRRSGLRFLTWLSGGDLLLVPEDRQVHREHGPRDHDVSFSCSRFRFCSSSCSQRTDRTPSAVSCVIVDRYDSCLDP